MLPHAIKQVLIIATGLYLFKTHEARCQVVITAPNSTPHILCWQEERKLVWADFQAKTKPDVPPEQVLPNMTVGAVTEANVLVYDRMSGNVRKGTTVRVEFDKSKSWVDNTGKPYKEYILAHEQVHFDIEELTARRIRQVLARCEKNKQATDGPEATAAIDCLYQEGSDLQNLYDEETLAGTNPLEQVRWMDIIAHDLKQLTQYRSTAADCNLY